MKTLLAIAVAALPLAAAPASALKHVNPPAFPKPPGFSHAVVAAGGRTIYVSGQVPYDKGSLVGAGDFAAQCRQVFENLKAVLAASGATFADVVKLNVFVTDASQLAAYRTIRDQYVGAEPPASTFVEVRALFKPEVMLEIDAIAVTAR